MLIYPLRFPPFSYILPIHFTVYLIIYFVCREVGSFLKLRKHIAEKSQGTIQQSLPFLEKSALLWRRQVCTTASLTFFICFSDRQARQVPLWIAGFEAAAFHASSAEGCSESTWAVASDEKGGNTSICSSRHGQGKNLADKALLQSQSTAPAPTHIESRNTIFRSFLKWTTACSLLVL